jgi:large subunit ribosomal protein L10e
MAPRARSVPQVTPTLAPPPVSCRARRYGLAARVHIGQPILSVRAQDKDLKSCVESFRRAKFKLPGRQKIVLSRKWGFTPFTRDEYAERMENGTLRKDGTHAFYIRSHGPLGY